jgi:hypothetical protein
VPAYAGGEPDQPPPSADSPAPDQATQLVDSVRLSYCQPYVGAFFNFLLWDEPSLYRWQSGVLWADGTKKGSYEPFRAAIAEANERRVDCSRMKGGGPFIQQSIPPQPAGRGGGEQASEPLDSSEPAVPRRKLPSGYFEQAKPSMLAYAGTRNAPYGFLRLAARLSSGGRPVAGKRIEIVAGGMGYAAITNRNGVARMPAFPPVPAGAWSIRLSFAGDPQIRPVSAAGSIVVRNTAARVSSAGRLQLRPRTTGSFRISSDGSRATGSVRLVAPELDFRAHRVTALGVGPSGRAAWFTGFNARGRRFWALVREGGPRVRNAHVRAWIGRSYEVSSVKLAAAAVRIARRPAAPASLR